jgi:hypothetical protein
VRVSFRKLSLLEKVFYFLFFFSFFTFFVSFVFRSSDRLRPKGMLLLLVLVSVSLGAFSAVEKYRNAGGCYGSPPGFQSCEGGWYASPGVTTMLGALPVMITCTSSITAFFAHNGTQIWRYPTPSISGDRNGRSWPDCVIEQVDGVGLPDVCAGYDNGFVSCVHLDTGLPLTGWPRRVLAGVNEVRSLVAADLDGDGKVGF